MIAKQLNRRMEGIGGGTWNNIPLIRKGIRGHFQISMLRSIV
jgi:hypothetical protein